MNPRPRLDGRSFKHELGKVCQFPPVMSGVRMKPKSGLVFALLSCIALSSVCLGADPLSGFPVPRTIQTHAKILGGVIFWDATPFAEKLISLNTSPKDAMNLLEYEAVKIFVTHAATLARTERHLRVIASFTKTGPINARYQTTTLEGVDTLFTLDGNLSRRMKFDKNWERNAQRGLLPSGIKLRVVTEIPLEGK